MNERNRAWRRRKMRATTNRLDALKSWFLNQVQKPGTYPDKEHKRHRPGALTHVQAMRERWNVDLDLRDAA